MQRRKFSREFKLEAVELIRERFYNPTRRHSTLGYLSSMDFERQALVA